MCYDEWTIFMDEKQFNSFATKHWIVTSRMISQINQNTYLHGMECFKAKGKKKQQKKKPNPKTVLKGK